MYLTYSTSTDAAQAIDGLNVFADSKAARWSIQSGYTRIEQDLAEGAGGKYIYACYTKNGTNPPITGLSVITGCSSQTHPVG